MNYLRAVGVLMDTVKCHYASKRLRKALVFLSILYFSGFPGGSDSKESTCKAGDRVLSESGRSPGGEHGNPLQYSCLESLMDRGAWWATVHGIVEADTTEQLSTAVHLL